MFYYRHVLIITLIATAGCLGTRSESVCTSASDCKSGFACASGTCQELCETHADCSASPCVQGLCSATLLPQVRRYEVEASGLTQQLVAEGRGLGQASFILSDAGGATRALAVRSQSATRAELILPPDVASGSYTLTAVNHAGTGSTDVTLTLPELDGDEIIARINDGATTGQIIASRLEPAPFASYRGYLATSIVSFSGTYYGLINPTTDFSYGGITESGGDISVSQGGVYMVTAVAKVGLQTNAKGYLMVSHLDSAGTPISNRFYLNDNDESVGGLSATLAGSTLFQLGAGDRLRFEVASSDNSNTWNVQGGSATSSPTVVTVQLIHP